MAFVSEGCQFKGCRLVPMRSSYCPRHLFLVDLYGLAKAEGIEFGYLCTTCMNRHEEELVKCDRCGSDVCAECRESHLCCTESL